MACVFEGTNGRHTSKPAVKATVRPDILLCIETECITIVQHDIDPLLLQIGQGLPYCFFIILQNKFAILFTLAQLFKSLGIP
jgi:hypothetical protein